MMQGCQTAGFAPRPREFECQQLVTGDPESENVQSLVGGSSADDLGGHVEWGAGSIPGAHKRLGGGNGQTEINQFDMRHIRSADKVPRADVAMDEALGVDVVQGIRHLFDQGKAMPLQTVYGPMLDQRIEAGAIDKLHDQIRLFVDGEAVFQGLDDIGVVHRRGDFTLAGLLQTFEAAFEKVELLQVT